MWSRHPCSLSVPWSTVCFQVCGEAGEQTRRGIWWLRVHTYLEKAGMSKNWKLQKIIECDVGRLPHSVVVLLLWDKHPFGNFMKALGILLARELKIGLWTPS